MGKWVTHAEVSTRGINILLYSKVCSTHFVKSCFKGHCSTLSFSCSQPSQHHLIFSSCFLLMPSPDTLLRTCNYPCSRSHSFLWVLLLRVSHQEKTTLIFKSKMSCWGFHSAFLVQYISLLFLCTVYNSASAENISWLANICLYDWSLDSGLRSK